LASASPWRRLLAESFAVIASILVAFAIDAAWDAHQEKQELRQILQGLRTEFLANQDRVQEGKARAGQAMEALTRFRSEVSPELDVQDSYNELYLPFVRRWDVALQTGFLDATISSGKLPLIPDPGTRASLTSLAADIEDLDRLNGELDRMAAEAAVVMGEYPNVRQLQGGVEIDRDGIRALRQDRRLQGLASARIIFLGGYWYNLESVIAPRLEEALDAIDSSLSAMR